MSTNVDFDVDEHGIIRTPGKYESEPSWVPAFHDYWSEGGGDEEVYGTHIGTTGDEATTAFFIVSEDDVRDHPALKGTYAVALWVSETGFVNSRTFNTREEYKKTLSEMQAAAEARIAEIADDEIEEADTGLQQPRPAMSALALAVNAQRALGAGDFDAARAYLDTYREQRSAGEADPEVISATPYEPAYLGDEAAFEVAQRLWLLGKGSQPQRPTYDASRVTPPSKTPETAHAAIVRAFQAADRKEWPTVRDALAAYRTLRFTGTAEPKVGAPGNIPFGGDLLAHELEDKLWSYGQGPRLTQMTYPSPLSGPKL